MTAVRDVSAMISRRVCLGLPVALAVVSRARASTYPSRQVTLTVPYAAGGTADILARLIAQSLQESLSQPFVIENKGGASGMIGAAAVAHAPSDGYSLLFTAGGPITIGPNLFKNPSYDSSASFTPIAFVGQVPSFLVVSASNPARTLPELIAAARAHPGTLKFASPGVGTSVHLMAELFRLDCEIEVIHVPYRGGGPAMNDLLGGQVDYMIENVPQLLPQVLAGTLRALAVTSSTRLPSAPDVPTFTEAGIQGLQVGTWFGLLGPRDLPADVADGLVKGLLQGLQGPAIKQHLRELEVQIDFRAGGDFAAFIAQDSTRWKDTIRRAKIEAE
jgi:tripartite-type tricarboxylate transporter receptor subunit TctC